MTARDGAAAAPHPDSRSKHLIAAVAVLLALWFGLAAPSVSPVAGPARPVVGTPVVQDQGSGTGRDGVAVVDRDGGRDGQRRR